MFGIHDAEHTEKSVQPQGFTQAYKEVDREKRKWWIGEANLPKLAASHLL